MSLLCMQSWAPDHDYMGDVHVLTSLQTMLNSEDGSIPSQWVMESACTINVHADSIHDGLTLLALHDMLTDGALKHEHKPLFLLAQTST